MHRNQVGEEEGLLKQKVQALRQDSTTSDRAGAFWEPEAQGQSKWHDMQDGKRELNTLPGTRSLKILQAWQRVQILTVLYSSVRER